MFEGKTLLEYFELGKILSRSSITLTEYNAMLPWHLEVHIFLLREEIESRKEMLNAKNQLG